MTKDLTIGSPLRVILWFTLPLLIGNLFQQLYAFVDAVVVGRLLGVEALAAVGASTSLVFLLFGFAMGTSAGLAIPVARAFGAGDLAAMRRFVATGIVISAGVTLAITGIGIFGSHTLLVWMGTPPELLGAASTFLAVFFGGSIATVSFNFLASVIRALGDSRTPLIFLIVASVLNATGVIWFIGGLGLGVGGAAAATVVSQLISVLACLVLISRRMPQLRLQRNDWRITRGDLGESARLGVTMGFQMSVIAVGTIILQYGINQLGADAVAAFTAAMRVDQLAVAPLASFGMAIATFVAQNRGGRQWRRVRDGVFRVSLVAVGVSLLIGAGIGVFGTELVGLFVGDGEPQVVQLAHQYLVINSALYVFLALLFVLRNTLQGLGSTKTPTLAGFMELALRAVAGVFLVAQWGFLGVALAAPLAWLAALIPLTWAWIRQRQQLIWRESRQLRAADSLPTQIRGSDLALAG